MIFAAASLGIYPALGIIGAVLTPFTWHSYMKERRHARMDRAYHASRSRAIFQHPSCCLYDEEEAP